MRVSAYKAMIGVCLLCSSGCGAGGRAESPYTPLGESDRNSAEAERLTRQAAEVMDKDPQRAEKLLREALTKDLYHGPAHNNLGVLFLSRGELYAAASELEFARKLMPGHPDPRINLALTLERAGRVEEAMRSYLAALEVYPEHIAAMQGLVRMQVRHDRRDDRTQALLEDVALRGESEAWREWAQRQLVRADGE